MSDLFSEIDIEELALLLHTDIYLVDVREQDEYESGHVPGAVHISLGSVAQRIDDCLDPSGGITYLICKVGGRSAQACGFLSEQGVPVVNIAGGTMAWIMSGRDVVEGIHPT